MVRLLASSFVVAAEAAHYGLTPPTSGSSLLTFPAALALLGGVVGAWPYLEANARRLMNLDGEAALEMSAQAPAVEDLPS